MAKSKLGVLRFTEPHEVDTHLTRLARRNALHLALDSLVRGGIGGLLFLAIARIIGGTEETMQQSLARSLLFAAGLALFLFISSLIERHLARKQLEKRHDKEVPRTP
jgi:hypothetical protein